MQSQKTLMKANMWRVGSVDVNWSWKSHPVLLHSHYFVAKTWWKTEMRKKEHVSKNREFLVLTSKKRVLIAEFLGGFCCCMYLKFSTSSGHMKKCLLTQFGWVRQENIRILVMKHRPSTVKSICHDLEQNIFLSGPPTQSIGAYNDILNLNLKKQ